jgi:hypothetical protein
MKFREFDLAFDLFDADDADAYEAAVKRVRAEGGARCEGESLGDTIRRQCTVVFNFFDELFGDGFHKDIFGQKANLVTCLEAFSEFVNAVEAQKLELVELAGQAGISLVPTQPVQPNRAARRAQGRNTGA